jgi:hypothetical protein
MFQLSTFKQGMEETALTLSVVDRTCQGVKLALLLDGLLGSWKRGNKQLVIAKGDTRLASPLATVSPPSDASKREALRAAFSA